MAVSVAVVLGAIGVQRHGDGTRTITTGDALLEAEVSRCIGQPVADGQWRCRGEQAFHLVHELRRHSATMPERGEVEPPAARDVFNFHTTWGRLSFHHHRWRQITIDARLCLDVDGLNAHAAREGYAWSDRFQNWILSKPQFDKLVLTHWRPVPAGGLATDVVATGPAADTRQTTEIDGYHYVTEPGRQPPKVDRDWYKTRGRWRQISSPMGNYQVFDLHDGCKGIFVNKNDLRDILATLGATKSRDINIFPMPPGGDVKVAEAIEAASRH